MIIIFNARIYKIFVWCVIPPKIGEEKHLLKWHLLPPIHVQSKSKSLLFSFRTIVLFLCKSM